MRKNIHLILGASLVILCAAISLDAATLAPELQSVLRNIRNQSEVAVILQFRERADLRPFQEGPRAVRRAKIIRALRAIADRSQRPVTEFLKARGAKRMDPLWLINGMAVTARAEVIRELANLPQIEEVRLDDVIPLYQVILEATTAAEWNIDAIRARDLWALGYKGRGIVVANMDTGVDVQHPDLIKRWRGGRNSWFDPYGRHSTPFDAHGHGTMTMGVMVGGNAGSTAIGVAPRARWIAVKIFDDNDSASSSAIHRGFQWLLDPDGNPDTDDAPDVVNNSWGIQDPGTCWINYEDDIAALKTAGIAVVFAAGNEGELGTFSSSAPANNPSAFSVGAVSRSLAIASFSSRGPSACDGSIFPQVVAPGVAIKSSYLTTSGNDLPYSIVSGTSFSAPHVSAAMALLLSAFPGLPVSALEQSLIATAQDLGPAGPDNSYGNGMIDVLEAHSFLLSTMNEMNKISQVSQDGWVRESFMGSGVGRYINAAGDLRVGDDAKNRQIKTILSFNTGVLPDNAIVTSATLLLTLKKTVGVDPFGTHGRCLVDAVQGTFNASALRANDFEAPATANRTARLTLTSRDSNELRGVFNENGLRAVNKLGLTQLRVYFSLPSDADATTDLVILAGDDAVQSQRPQLKITYTLP